MPEKYAMIETPRARLVQSLEMKEGCSTAKMLMKEDFSLPESKDGHLMSLLQKLTKNRIALEMIHRLS